MKMKHLLHGKKRKNYDGSKYIIIETKEATSTIGTSEKDRIYKKIHSNPQKGNATNTRRLF